MVWMLLACNILAGAAIALTFRPLMIVVLAPVLLVASAALLYHQEIGFWPSIFTLVACLIMGQVSFALTSALTRNAARSGPVTSVRDLLDRLR